MSRSILVDIRADTQIDHYTPLSRIDGTAEYLYVMYTVGVDAELSADMRRQAHGCVSYGGVEPKFKVLGHGG